MVNAKLVKQRGCYVDLRRGDIDFHRCGYSSANQHERYAVARQRVVKMMRIGSLMVGDKQHNRVFPHRQFPQFIHKLAQTVVGVGECILHLVVKLMKRHLKRLMAARRLQDSEYRPPRIRIGFKVGEHPFKHQMVGRSPLACTVFQREILVRYHLVESCRHQICQHIGEIGITPIIIFQVVALSLHCLRYRRQMLHLLGKFHNARARLCGIATDYRHQTAVGAETVAPEISASHALPAHGVKIGCHILTAERRQQVAAETFEDYENHIGTVRGKQPRHRVGISHRLVAQSLHQTFRLGIVHKTILRREVGLMRH